jgi:hypothetical protein
VATGRIELLREVGHGDSGVRGRGERLDGHRRAVEGVTFTGDSKTLISADLFLRSHEYLYCIGKK